jgi:SAM-dependent methyltransferase/uncharacterized protein YbaR (Trm112 family)
MRESIVERFICPSCRGNLALTDVRERQRDEIKEGTLTCKTGGHVFSISGFIPRFVPTEGPAASFGFEWNKHPRTQLDSANGMELSRRRFFRSTNWPTDLSEQTILEIGSGAGRFTEVALQTGAEVFSIDASRAVDANWANNGHHPHLTVCQASLYKLPFRENTFDNVFCFGVLQHTPDVAQSFEMIARFPGKGGRLAVDVYNRDYWRNYHTPIYLLRPLTRHIASDKLYKTISITMPALMRASSWLRKVPCIGRQLSALIPIANYDGLLPTDSKELIEQHSLLDTFDTLSPRYISPQSPSVVDKWFQRAGYQEIEASKDTVFFMRGVRLSLES